MLDQLSTTKFFFEKKEGMPCRLSIEERTQIVWYEDLFSRARSNWFECKRKNEFITQPPHEDTIQ